MFRLAVSLGLLSASLSAATLELKNGKSLTAEIKYAYLDFVYVVAGAKPGDARAVWLSEIANIKDATPAEEQLLSFAKPVVAEFPQPETERKARTVSAAQLEAWYGGNLKLSSNDVAAQKIPAAEALIANYLAATDNSKAAKLLQEIGALKLPPETLRAVLRHGHVPQTAAPKTGEFDTIVAVKDKDRERRMQLAARVPEKYTHDKAWPLIISLHGTRGHCNYIAVWHREDTDGFIVVAPWADSSHGWGPSTYGRTQVMAALEWAQTHYRIDPRRIFLDGFSMGGIGVKRLAAFTPDYFAGICCRSGPPIPKNIARLYRNLHHTPFVSFSGEKDELNPLTIIQAEKDLCEAEKLPAKLHIFEGRGHEGFTERNADVLDLFDRCERENMPETLRFSSYEDGPGLQHYYIEITETDRGQNQTVVSNVMNILWIIYYANGDLVKQRDTKSMVEYAQHEKLDGATVEKRTTWLQPREVDVKLDRERNAVHIERAALVKALRIYVDDELLDMSKEIEVLDQGKVIAKKMIQRNPQFMLNHARKTGRRDITYWGALDVKLER